MNIVTGSGQFCRLVQIGLIENQLKGYVFAKQAMITSPFTKVKKIIVIK
jgi:hypothetical protein